MASGSPSRCCCWCCRRFSARAGALTTFSLIGISIIFSLSYNILLGQTGMLSFGHAVYYGLGGFLVIHAINIIGANKLPIPLPLVPLIGGLTGLFFAALLGWVSTQRSGTAFAMISLGVAELIASSALILRTFFGGEAGISANRTKLLRVFDWNFGPQIQIYYLVAAWTLIAVIAMYALTRTPLGRMCNAVRDNPERVQFVGYDPHVVRYLAFCFAGFFAGIAGALAAINFEIANSAYLGAVQSGTVLFATYIGGVGFFIGPIVGAIFVTLLSLGLSDLTPVWQLYFGLIFIAVVMFAPGGITGLLMMHRPLLKGGTLGKVLPSYLIALVPTLAMIAGLVLAIETIVHHTVNPGEDPNIKAFGVSFNAASPIIWMIAAVPDRRRICRRAQDLELGRAGLGRGAHGGARKGISTHDAPAIELREVQKSFGNISIIRDLNLSVAQGERHALIGPNGAGKSTTFNLISGYMTPTSGSGTAARRGDLRSAALSDQSPRPVAQLSGHQRLRQYERVGKPALRRAVDRRPSLRVLEEHRQSAGSARSHRADARRHQPDCTARRARRASDLCRTARAGDRHHHCRRRRRHPARRADRGHEPRRDRARGRIDPPPDRRPHAGDRRARHERGVRTGRPDFGAGLRPYHRVRNAGRDSADPKVKEAYLGEEAA